MILQRLEQPRAVGLVQSDELLDEMAEQQAALTADRMDTDHRMLGFIDGRGKDIAMLRDPFGGAFAIGRSEEHTSELQSLMRISYAVFCLKKKNNTCTRLEIHFM